jgi:predicted nucleotidyltransferase
MPDVRLAVLFGSSSRGIVGADSDVDLGIRLRPGTDQDFRLSVALEREIRRPVDVVWLDTAAPLLRFEIARNGLLLVERDAHGWADFRARAMIDWWDWAPTAKMMHQVMAARLRQEATRGSP